MPNSDLQILLCLTPDNFTRQRETPQGLKDLKTFPLKIFIMMCDSQHIVNFTVYLSFIGIDMICSPENMKLMNPKQKVLVGGKQLKDNTQKGKLRCTFLKIYNKLVLLA